MDVAAALKQRRAELRGDGPPPGRRWCEAWTDEVDDALRTLSEPVLERGRLVVAAVGGYGRRELCPWSDLDLLIIHDGVAEDVLETVVRDVIYPLWDAGLQVGYAVRGRKLAVSATDDLDAATALVDARKLAGDGALLHQVRDAALARMSRKPARFLGELTDADVARRARVGDTAEALEPDLKNGAGGLRDVQSMRWAAAAIVGTAGLDPLVSARYLGAPDRSSLARAYDRLLAVRVALHLELERGSDVLRLDLQQAVAERLGYVDGGDDRDTAAHRLLRDLFLAGRTVDHVHRRAWNLLSADSVRGRRFRRPSETEVDGFGLADNVLRIEGEPALVDAALPTRIMAALARTGAVLDRTTAGRLARAVERLDEPLAWDAASRRRFVETLWRGDAALVALAELDDVGLLVALLPEWAPVRGRAQRNPFHRYSVDRHAWHAAATLAELVRREEWAATALESVEDRDGLILGVLLHDVGKAYGEPHSETGVPVARSIVRRMGAGADTLELVERMVRDHLLLPDVATKRDVSDPLVASQLADRVGNREHLACLHLLAAADGLATGPSAWTSWKATLVDGLVGKVTAALDEQHPDELADGATATAREAQRIAEELGSTPDVIREHLAALPSRYAAAVTARAVVRHAKLAGEGMQPAEVRTRVTPGAPVAGERAHDELDVVAVDSPGLFAKVAGVLALHGGSVLTADAFTRTDGVAVDTFTVHKPDDATGSWWAAVEGDIDEAVAGRLAVRARVARKAAGEARRVSRLPDVPTRVTSEPDPSGRATVVEVHTIDRLGVLYAIVSAMAELELDIVVARIQTMGHEVVDVFYVRDPAGNPLDEHHLAELDLAVTSAIERLAL